MSDQLTITTLGGLSIRLDGEPVTDLASRKVEALLVYVASAERPQSREMLAEMLWDSFVCPAASRHEACFVPNPKCRYN